MLFDMPSFMTSSVCVDSCRPNMPVNDALSAVSTELLVEKNVTAWAYTRSLAFVVCSRRAMITSEVL